jgi:hypothetical protein
VKSLGVLYKNFKVNFQVNSLSPTVLGKLK